MTDFDIDWINETKPTVSYRDEAFAEYDAGLGDGIDKFTKRFMKEHGLTKRNGDDIGGLIIFSRKGKLFGVYDYENFWGWVV